MTNEIIINFNRNNLQHTQQSDLDVVIDNIIRLSVSSNKEIIALDNGHHTIKMSFKYLGGNCGMAMMDFDVVEGERVKLTYNPPQVVTMGGNITVEKVAAPITPVVHHDSPTTTQVEKPNANLVKYNKTINSDASLESIGFVPIELSNENNLIKVKKLDSENANFYVSNATKREMEVYPSKNIALEQMSKTYSPWFEMEKGGLNNVFLVTPCKIVANNVTGKYELVNKGQVTISSNDSQVKVVPVSTSEKGKIIQYRVTPALKDVAVKKAQTPVQVRPVSQQPIYTQPKLQPFVNPTGKSKTVAGILAIILGGFGIHKFYLGKIGMGLLYLVFCSTYIPAILGLIEGITYLTSTEEQFYEKFCKK